MVATTAPTACTKTAMVITIDFLKDCFDTFNRLCFDSSLPVPHFRLSNVRTYLGQMRKKVTEKRWFRKTTEYTLTLNTRYPLEEHEAEDIVLHEMIHYYIMLNGLRDSCAHGKIFRSMMEQINRQYGRHICISDKRHRNTETDTGKQCSHILCIVTLLSGKQGIIIPPHTRIHDFHRQLRHLQGIADAQWYESEDPYFNRFPHPRTIKIYQISTDDLHTHLKHARPVALH